jgi:hypothetical protein
VVGVILQYTFVRVLGGVVLRERQPQSDSHRRHSRLSVAHVRGRLGTRYRPRSTAWAGCSRYTGSTTNSHQHLFRHTNMRTYLETRRKLLLRLVYNPQPKVDLVRLVEICPHRSAPHSHTLRRTHSAPSAGHWKTPPRHAPTIRTGHTGFQCHTKAWDPTRIISFTTPLLRRRATHFGVRQPIERLLIRRIRLLQIIHHQVTVSQAPPDFPVLLGDVEHALVIVHGLFPRISTVRQTGQGKGRTLWKSSFTRAIPATWVSAETEVGLCRSACSYAALARSVSFNCSETAPTQFISPCK